jgi:hypothetical protein
VTALEMTTSASLRQRRSSGGVGVLLLFLRSRDALFSSLAQAGTRWGWWHLVAAAWRG